MSEAAVLRRDEGAVAILTLNRPAVLNAIDTATMRLLGEHVHRLSADGAVNVVVLTGAGERAFSAGGDIKEMSTFAGLACDVAMQAWQDTLGLIMRAPKPFIAAINGDALGGGTELAMACHLRVVADHARLGQPEILLHHIPGGGGTQRLPRLIPLGLAYEYLLTGEPIPAEEAHRIGLVNHVWPAGELMTRTLELAGRIAGRGPVAVRLTLEAVREGLDSPLEVGLRLERALASLALESEEAKAGLEAFLAKRRKRDQT